MDLPMHWRCAGAAPPPVSCRPWPTGWLSKAIARKILERKQVNVERAMLQHWCTYVTCSEVEPMKEVAALVHRHREGIVAWAQTRQTNSLFEVSTRRARGFTRFDMIRTTIFLIACKLDFCSVNPYAGQPTGNSTEPKLMTPSAANSLTRSGSTRKLGARRCRRSGFYMWCNLLAELDQT
jgi:Transposase